MDCDRYLELLALHLDGELSEEEDRERNEHLAVCPDCRAAGAQLAALQSAFAELEEISAPEGFTQGVMNRIRDEARPKVVPLFQRPQIRALAGLAACLVLVVGLYGAGRFQQKTADQDRMFRSFNQGAVKGFADVSAQESLRGGEDGPKVNASLADPEPEDAPQIAAYTMPESSGMQKAAPSSAADGIDRDSAYAEFVLTLDRMPEGAAELIPPETAAQPNPGGGTVYQDVPKDVYDRIGQLAAEQGMTVAQALTGDGGAEDGPFALIILEE